MLNIKIITGVSDLEVESPIIEEKDISKYNGDCFADVYYTLVLSPIKPELNNLSFFAPVIAFSIKNIKEEILFMLKVGIGFQLKDFHVYTNVEDLEDCIYEVYNQGLLKIQKECPPHIKNTPFKIPTSKHIYPHLLECIQKVYADFSPKL